MCESFGCCCFFFRFLKKDLKKEKLKAVSLGVATTAVIMGLWMAQLGAIMYGALFRKP